MRPCAVHRRSSADSLFHLVACWINRSESRDPNVALISGRTASRRSVGRWRPSYETPLVIVMSLDPRQNPGRGIVKDSLCSIGRDLDVNVIGHPLPPTRHIIGLTDRFTGKDSHV